MDLRTKIHLTDFEELFNYKGYAYFTKGKFNLNIIGVRANPGTVNKFDDFLVLEYIDQIGHFCKRVYPITTDPGIYWLNNPENFLGTAVLCAGQYRGCWTFGLHKNKYEALVQTKPVTVYRDKDKDDEINYGVKIDKGIFGINIHKAGDNSKQVDKWSAGCQVFAKSMDFDEFMKICHLQESFGLGNKFTYTLINEKDLGVFEQR